MAHSILREVLRTKLSAYVTLVERRVDIGGRVESFHSLAQADYFLVIGNNLNMPRVRPAHGAAGLPCSQPSAAWHLAHSVTAACNS